jgi:ribonuclease HI
VNLRIHFSGICPVPGKTASWAYFVESANAYSSIEWHDSGPIKESSLSYAEWCGLGKGLFWLEQTISQLKPRVLIDDLEILGDSRSVLEQLDGLQDCDEDTAKLRDRCYELLRILNLHDWKTHLVAEENNRAFGIAKQSYELATKRHTRVSQPD